MSRLKRYKVRVAKVWEMDVTAYDREAAIETLRDYIREGGDAEDYSTASARVLRPATPDEIADYLGDTLQDDTQDDKQDTTEAPRWPDTN